MAFNTHSRRDLYASSEPRPKDSSKRRNGSPPKKNSPHKNALKKPKKMSKEEISGRTYKSISLLLDAARVLDEEEKKASKPSPVAKSTGKAKKTNSSKPTPSSSDFSLVSPPPVATVPPPSQSPIKPIHDDHQYTASTTISSSFNFHNDHPSSSTTVHTQPLEESTKTELLASSTTAVPLSASTPLEPLSLGVPEATVPMLSPLSTTFRPSGGADSMHRPVAALPIPAELRDIAVPIAHRSVSTVTRVVATKSPRKPRGPNKKKAKTTAEISEEIELKMNFGYPNECRTRIPPALRRYWDRLERQKRQSEVFFHDYFWQ